LRANKQRPFQQRLNLKTESYAQTDSPLLSFLTAPLAYEIHRITRSG
jgi:hypothetical protein